MGSRVEASSRRPPRAHTTPLPDDGLSEAQDWKYWQLREAPLWLLLRYTLPR